MRDSVSTILSNWLSVTGMLGRFAPVSSRSSRMRRREACTGLAGSHVSGCLCARFRGWRGSGLAANPEADAAGFAALRIWLALLFIALTNWRSLMFGMGVMICKVFGGGPQRAYGSGFRVGSIGGVGMHLACPGLASSLIVCGGHDWFLFRKLAEA